MLINKHSQFRRTTLYITIVNLQENPTMQRTYSQSIFAEHRKAKNARDSLEERYRIIWKNPTSSTNSQTRKRIGNKTPSDTRSTTPGNVFRSPDCAPINAKNKNAMSVRTQHLDAAIPKRRTRRSVCKVNSE